VLLVPNCNILIDASAHACVHVKICACSDAELLSGLEFLCSLCQKRSQVLCMKTAACSGLPFTAQFTPNLFQTRVSGLTNTDTPSFDQPGCDTPHSRRPCFWSQSPTGTQFGPTRLQHNKHTDTMGKRRLPSTAFTPHPETCNRSANSVQHSNTTHWTRNSCDNTTR
jgi:hypothetical protein